MLAMLYKRGVAGNNHENLIWYSIKLIFILNSHFLCDWDLYYDSSWKKYCIVTSYHLPCMRVEKFSATEILPQILMFFFMMYLSDFKTIHDEIHLLPIFFFLAVFYVDRCTTEEISYIYSKEMHQVTVKICEWRMVQKTTSNSPFRLHNCFATVHIHIYFFIFGPKKSLSCCTSVMALEVCMWTRCHLDAKMFAVWLVFALHTKQ